MEFINKCFQCGLLEPEPSHFFKSHKISQADYYVNNYSKKDLLTKEILPFRDLDSYFLNDFLNKINLKKYLDSLDEKGRKDYCKNLLNRRIRAKNLTFAPSQTELKSILSPSILYLDKLFTKEGGYYSLCEKLGLKNKYVSFNIGNPTSLEKNYTKSNVLIDTRENKVIKFRDDINIKIQKLDFADYTLENQDLCGKLHIERKSLMDFIGSFSANIDRLHREFDRAKELGAHIVVMVEEDISKALVFNKLPYIVKRSRKMRVTPDFVFHNIRDIYQKYDNIQFLFVNGVTEMQRLIPQLLFNGEFYKKFDLELLYEKGLL